MMIMMSNQHNSGCAATATPIVTATATTTTASNNTQTTATTDKAQKGWLSRWTRKQWSRHWFVLKNGSLTYYRGPAAELCSFLDGVLDLSLIKHIEVNNNLIHHHNPHQYHHHQVVNHLLITGHTHHHQPSVQTNNNNPLQFTFTLKMWNGECHQLGAGSEAERQLWLEAINATINGDDDADSSSSTSSSSNSSDSSPTSNLLSSASAKSIEKIANLGTSNQNKRNLNLNNHSLSHYTSHPLNHLDLNVIQKRKEEEESEAERHQLSLDHLALTLKTAINKRRITCNEQQQQQPDVIFDLVVKQDNKAAVAETASMNNEQQNQEAARHQNNLAQRGLPVASGKSPASSSSPSSSSNHQQQLLAKQKKRVTFDLSKSSHRQLTSSSSSGSDSDSDSSDSSASSLSSSSLSALSSSSSDEEEAVEQDEEIEQQGKGGREVKHQKEEQKIRGQVDEGSLSSTSDNNKVGNVFSREQLDSSPTDGARTATTTEVEGAEVTEIYKMDVGNEDDDEKEKERERLLSISRLEDKVNILEVKLNDSYENYGKLELDYKRLQGELLKCDELRKSELARLQIKFDQLKRELDRNELNLVEAREKLVKYEQHQFNNNDEGGFVGLTNKRRQQEEPIGNEEQEKSLDNVCQSTTRVKIKQSQQSRALTNWLKVANNNNLSNQQQQQVSILNQHHLTHKPPLLLTMHHVKHQMVVNQQTLGLKLLNHSKQIQRKLNELELKVDKVVHQSTTNSNCGQPNKE